MLPGHKKAEARLTMSIDHSPLVVPPTRTQLKDLGPNYRLLAIAVFNRAVNDLWEPATPKHYQADAREFLLAHPLGQRDVDIIFAHWYNHVARMLPLRLIRKRVTELTGTRRKI